MYNYIEKIESNNIEQQQLQPECGKQSIWKNLTAFYHII